MACARSFAGAAALVVVFALLAAPLQSARAQAACDPLSPTLATTLGTEIATAVLSCIGLTCSSTCRNALTAFTTNQCVAAACGTFSGACNALTSPLDMCGMTLPPFSACSFDAFRTAMTNVTTQCTPLFAGGSPCSAACQGAVSTLLANECSRRFCVGACQTTLENAQRVGCRALRALQNLNETLVQAGGQIYRYFNQSGGALQLNITGLADVSLQIPANALPDSAATSSVALSLLTNAFQTGVSLANAGLGAAAQFAGPSIAFTPHGLTFSTPVTLRIPYRTSTTVPAGMRLCVTVAASDTSTTATLVPGCGTVDATSGYVSVTVSSFSVYSVALVPQSSGAAAAAVAPLAATALAALLAVVMLWA